MYHQTRIHASPIPARVPRTISRVAQEGPPSAPPRGSAYGSQLCSLLIFAENLTQPTGLRDIFPLIPGAASGNRGADCTNAIATNSEETGRHKRYKRPLRLGPSTLRAPARVRISPRWLCLCRKPSSSAPSSRHCATVGRSAYDQPSCHWHSPTSWC